MNHANDRHFRKAYRNAVGHSHARRDTHRLPAQASLAAEIAGSEDRDHRFLSLFGEHGHSDLAVLNVEYRIRGITLREDEPILVELDDCRAAVGAVEQGIRVEWKLAVIHRRVPGV